MTNKVNLILCLLLLGHCFGQFSPDSLRIAHIQWPGKDKPIPQQFLIDAKANGYNYVLCEYVPYWSEWNDSGKIVSPRPTNFEKRLTQHFQQADSAGLRLIPELQTGDIHGEFYHDYINKLIPGQLIHQKLPDAMISDYRSFVVSTDSSNAGADLMNNAFDSLWTMVFNAFDHAKKKMRCKNLDFVHLGYDENYYSWKNDPLAHIIPLVGLCGPDTSWLTTQGLKGSSTETQIQRLYAANIKKRVNHISSISKKFGCITKSILWADMLDPELYPPDVYSFRNLFDPALQSNDPSFDAQGSLVKVSLIGALQQSDMQSVKDNLIFCPWVYDTVARGGRYLPRNAIDTFTARGYKVLYACAGSTYLQPLYIPGSEAEYQNALEFARAAHDRKFTSKSIGYIATAWSDVADVDSRQGSLIWNPDSNYIKPFNLMGILAKINNRCASNAFR